MTLSDFYDRCLRVDPSLSEGVLRALLTEALEKVSLETGAPRLRVEASIGTTVITARIRRMLTVPDRVGARNRELLWVDDPDEGTLTVANVREPFWLTFELYPPVVPEDATSTDGQAFVVPFASTCLAYVLSGLYTDQERVGSARVQYARYQSGLIDVKRSVRDGADVRRLSATVDPAIWP
ncbi:MAG TPA: hypothetical protein VF594_10950 [Rubricoccaceae bacterium]